MRHGYWTKCFAFGAVGVLLALIICACQLVSRPQASVEDLGLQPARMPAPIAGYYDVASLGDNLIALAAPNPGQDARIDIVDAGSGAIVSGVPLPPAKRPDCNTRQLGGLARLADGRLAFGDVCTGQGGLPTRTTLLYAYNHRDGSLTALGGLADAPSTMTWTSDLSEVVYTAGTSLCQTIYARTPNGDGPLAVTVLAQGREMSLGEDVVASDDRCTKRGNASDPALNSDGLLAAFAASTGGTGGSDRLDLPWALVLVTGKSAQVIVDGIQNPGGVEWVGSHQLILSGRLLGRAGMWLVDSDGSQLAQVGDLALAPFSISANGTEVVGLALAAPLPDNPDDIDMGVYRYDLSSIVQPD